MQSMKQVHRESVTGTEPVEYRRFMLMFEGTEIDSLTKLVKALSQSAVRTALIKAAGAQSDDVEEVLSQLTHQLEYPGSTYYTGHGQTQAQRAEAAAVIAEAKRALSKIPLAKPPERPKKSAVEAVPAPAPVPVPQPVWRAVADDDIAF